MRLNISRTLLLPMTLFITQCGGGDTFSKEDAQKAATVVQGAIGKALAGAPQALSAAQDEQIPENISVDYEYTCTGGGTAQVTGMIGAAGASAGNYDVDVSFAACVEDGVTLDGSIAYRIAVMVSQDIANPLASFDVSMDGTVTYSGDLSGECVFDLSISGSATGATVEGSVCGVDATEVNISYASGLGG
jgi:hypothetical protein